MQRSRVPSILLALALQILPVSRVFTALTPSAGSSFAIVSTWIAGLATLLGSYQAVSGASTTITSPKTALATNGLAFSYRVTTGPDTANWFAASNLPPGLTISTTVGRITGTPISNGVYTVLLTASDNQRLDRTIRTNLVITVLPTTGGGPVFLAQPQSTRTVEGATITLSATVTGPTPLRYLWRRNNVGIPGATNSTLTLNTVSTNQAGTYALQVATPYSAGVSSNALVSVIPAPRIASHQLVNGQFELSFVREPGPTYEILTHSTETDAAWQPWTNWPPATLRTETTVSDLVDTNAARLYQLRMTLP